MNNNEHMLDLNDLFKRLNTKENGLTSDEVGRRLKQYGFNILEIKEKTPLFSNLPSTFSISFTAHYSHLV